MPTEQEAIELLRPRRFRSSLSRPHTTHNVDNETIYTHRGTLWEPGPLKRLPWAPLVTLLLALCCMASCFGVLFLSDGKRVDDWPIMPSVLLAIFSATANTCLRYSLTEGANITWWTRALRGATLKDLSQFWSSGTSFVSAGTAGRSFSLLSLANIVVTLVVIDGPLLQRSSSISLAIGAPTRHNVSATIATQLPFGYTGFEMMGGGGQFTTQQPLLQDHFQKVMQEYKLQQPISASIFSGCDGTCSGTVQAAKLYPVDCTSDEEKKVWMTPKTMLNSTEGTAFLISLTWSESGNMWNYWNTSTYTHVLQVPEDPTKSDEPFIWMNVTYSPQAIYDPPENRSDSDSLPSDYILSGSYLVHKTCKLYSATGSYPITIYNDTMTASQDPVQNSTASNIIKLSGAATPINGTIQNMNKNMVELFHEQNLTTVQVNPIWFADYDDMRSDVYTYPLRETLSGLSSAAQNLLGSDVSLKGKAPGHTNQGPVSTGTGNPSMGVEFSGSLSRDFLRADSPGLTGKDGSFGLTWDDPTAYVTSVLDEIMFRTAVDAARADAFEHVYQGNEDYNFSYFPQPQRLEVVETRTSQVFQSNYNFLAAALAVMALATLVVVPTFYDYWMLGRDTSLNPVEIAKAFGAPILHDARSSASAEELLKEVGVVNVRYGKIHTDDASENHEFGDVDRSKRLEIAPSWKVEPPVTGELYY